MKRAYRILPCYAGDVSGVCAALYELEGMVVIHDPSGCNSTYNTHDETRWYAQDSMIYLSGLSELDAILGSDKRLLEEVCETAMTLRPRFVALAGSPIPFLSGMDLAAIARLIEQRTGIPSFYVPTNGLRDYNKGIENAFRQLERRFLTDQVNKRPRTVNILGMTPLDYGPTSSAQSLYAWLEGHGWQIQSCWATDTSLDKIRAAGQAEVNLVVSAAGLSLAEALQERYGTPYVVGIPIGGTGSIIAEALRRAADTGTPQLPCLYRGDMASGAPFRQTDTSHADPVQLTHSRKSLTLVGEPVTMGSIAAAISEWHHVETHVVCPLHVDNRLLTAEDRYVRGEEELEQVLSDSRSIIADPMYRPVCPDGAILYPLAHQAFSGRNGWRSARDLITMEI